MFLTHALIPRVDLLTPAILLDHHPAQPDPLRGVGPSGFETTEIRTPVVDTTGSGNVGPPGLKGT